MFAELSGYSSSKQSYLRMGYSRITSVEPELQYLAFYLVTLYSWVYASIEYLLVNTVAYGPVPVHRPRNGRVQPLLCNRCINKLPFLSNGSVNTSPPKRYPDHR
jgi:hypothetical protein